MTNQSYQQSEVTRGMANEDGHWMEKAFNPAHKGRLHRKLGVPQGQKIPAGKLAKAEHAGGKLGAEARLAAVARHGAK